MARQITINALAKIMKRGFAKHDQRIKNLEKGFLKQGRRLDDFAITMKLGFEKHGKQILDLVRTTQELKHEVALNGDAIAVLTHRFDAEMAANQGAHQRFEERFDQIDQRFEKMDQRFEKIDQRFDQMDQRFEKMDQRFEKMDQRFEKMDQKLGHIDLRLNRLDQRFNLEPISLTAS